MWLQFLYFALYSFIGWICETIYCSLIDRKFVNRGFLNGPFCPIYGVGAILVFNLFSWCGDNVGLLFILSTITTSLVEYLTSYILEVVFHLQLWDYSKRLINLNGRVCAQNSIIFGIMSVLLVRFIHPTTGYIFSNIPPNLLIFISITLAIYFIVDTIFTARVVLQINRDASKRQMQLNELTKIRDEFKQKLLTLKDTKLDISNIPIVTHIKYRLSHRRFIKAFPSMKSSRYQEALSEMKKEILSKIKKS